LTAEWAAKL